MADQLLSNYTEDERQKLFHHTHLNIPHNTFMKELLFNAKFIVRCEGVHKIHGIKNTVSKEKLTIMSNNISMTTDL